MTFMGDMTFPLNEGANLSAPKLCEEDWCAVSGGISAGIYVYRRARLSGPESRAASRPVLVNSAIRSNLRGDFGFSASNCKIEREAGLNEGSRLWMSELDARFEPMAKSALSE
jgi:hypothetical protein